MSKCLLISGGLDSACLWWIMDKPPALFIGGPHGPAREAALAEAQAVARMADISPDFADKLVMVAVDWRQYQRPGQWMFPRDELCAITAWGAGFDGIALGWNKDDGMTAAKAESAAAHIRQAVPREFPFEVTFPAWHLSKREMVAAAMEAGAPRAFIEASHSCVTASEPCGKCLNCRHREAALV